jgi:hypothetical protein
MSYKITQHQTRKTRMIELSLSADQTISVGQIVLFDTIRASHVGHGVSLSSGIIQLDQTRNYWMQASMDVTRASYTSDAEFTFYNASGTAMTAAEGAFPAVWEYHSPTPASGRANATYTAAYVSTGTTESAVSLRASSISSASVINSQGFKILIVEVE